MKTLKESLLDPEDMNKLLDDIESSQRIKLFNNRKNNRSDGRDMFRKPLTVGDYVLFPYKKTTYDDPRILLDVIDKIIQRGECRGECRLQGHGYIKSNYVIKVDDDTLRLLGVKI